MDNMGKTVRFFIIMVLCAALLFGAALSVSAADGVFAGISRAEAVTLIWQTLGSPEPLGSEPVYSDVPVEAPCFKAVLWGREKEVLPAAERLYADAACTKSYFVYLLWKAWGSPVCYGPSSYSDVSDDAYYRRAFRWAEDFGLVPAIGGAFCPEMAIGRTQAETLLKGAQVMPEFPIAFRMDADGMRYVYEGVFVTDDWVIYSGRAYHFDSTGRLDEIREQAPPMETKEPQDGLYVHPMLANRYNTSEERIEAMIAAAREYLGDPYVGFQSVAPGTTGVDCSGLVMQALYAAGYDPYPASPKHHLYTEYDSRTIWTDVEMPYVELQDIKRGDLVFYKKQEMSKLVNHVAIYLGNGYVIESWPGAVTEGYKLLGPPHEVLMGIKRPFE